MYVREQVKAYLRVKLLALDKIQQKRISGDGKNHFAKYGLDGKCSRKGFSELEV